MKDKLSIYLSIAERAPANMVIDMTKLQNYLTIKSDYFQVF